MTTTQHAPAAPKPRAPLRKEDTRRASAVSWETRS
jgi:hypothetical protein